MRVVLLAAFSLAVALGALACVDVPSNIRAQFAGASPTDRSNYRQGQHGAAPPTEASPAAKASPASTTRTGAPDGGTDPASGAPPIAPLDGGVS